MDERVERERNREAIEFFRSLINYKCNLGKPTRPANFAGHIGRHMTSDLKKWFLAKYPNNSDFVKFFHKNDSVFHYDCISGDVRLHTSGQRFVKPNRLTELEAKCAEPSISLISLSQNVSEMELFLVVFKLFVNNYELNKTIETSVQKLAEVFDDQKYERLFKQISQTVANPLDNCEKFEIDLMTYLSDNYSTVFDVDKHRMFVRLQTSVTEAMKKVSVEIDDSVYLVFKCLVAKYLETKGERDVDLLYDSIADRHEFIIGHIFGPKHSQDYTLLDFVDSYPKTFTFEKVLNPEGQVFRMIGLKCQTKEPEIDNCLDNRSDDPNSDDEIYYEDEEDLELPMDVKPKTQMEGKEKLKTEAKFKISLNDHLIGCCVDNKEKSSQKVMALDKYKKWAKDHNLCLLSKLVPKTIEEINKRFEAKPNPKFMHTIEVQTISTGNVQTRCDRDSGDQ